MDAVARIDAVAGIDAVGGRRLGSWESGSWFISSGCSGDDRAPSSVASLLLLGSTPHVPSPPLRFFQKNDRPSATPNAPDTGGEGATPPVRSTASTEPGSTATDPGRSPRPSTPRERAPLAAATRTRRPTAGPGEAPMAPWTPSCVCRTHRGRSGAGAGGVPAAPS